LPRRASRPSRYDSTTSRLSLYDILVPARRPYKPSFPTDCSDAGSGSESSGLVEAPSADALATVPLTPGDGQAQGLRRSLREHKKPRPYYAGAEPQPPDKWPAGKGLQRGFFN